MNVSEFLKKRTSEIEWLSQNGFDNGDPFTNGEYDTLSHLAPLCSLFFDIGANAGDFSRSALALMKSGKVIAVEPNPRLIEPLRDLLNIRGEVHNVAISDKSGISQIHIHPNDSTTSSLHERTDMMPSFREQMQSVTIDVKTLDDFSDSIAAVQGGVFFKIDTEGFELPVLRGASSVFSTNRPQIILFEYCTAWKEFGFSLKEAWHLLSRFKFTLHRITPFGLERLKFYEPIHDCDHYCNYLAVNDRVDLASAFKQRLPIASISGTSELLVFNNSGQFSGETSNKASNNDT